MGHYKTKCPNPLVPEDSGNADFGNGGANGGDSAETGFDNGGFSAEGAGGNDEWNSAPVASGGW
jgi:uncharacterized membrane protein YgcG